MFAIAPVRLDWDKNKSWWQRVLANRRARKALKCEPVAVEEDGWSEWIHPVGVYRAQCCDCGLIHEMEFAIVPRHESNSGPLNEGEGENVIIFRARRA